MTAYSLFVHQREDAYLTAAGDQKEALADFGKQLGQKLDTEDLMVSLLGICSTNGTGMAIGPTTKFVFLRHRYKPHGDRTDPTPLCRDAIRVQVSRGICIAIAAFATVASAAGYDPKAVFYSDIVLRGAIENIGRMKKPSFGHSLTTLLNALKRLHPMANRLCRGELCL